jgi:predicted  nucleic acid-binding Zn-ribbon protein
LNKSIQDINIEIETIKKSQREITKHNQTGKGMNKNIQDIKIEIETIKKSQREITLELENLEKRSGVIDASITNIIQEIEER